MGKIRVFQLAKELQVQSALVLELLDRLGQEVKSDLSILEEGVADLVRQRVTVAIAAERRRIEDLRRLPIEAGPEPEPRPAEASESLEVPVLAALAAREMRVDRPAGASSAPAEIERPAAAASPAATPVGPPAPGGEAGPRKPRLFPARRLVPHPSVRSPAARPAPSAPRPIPQAVPGPPRGVPAAPGAGAPPRPPSPMVARARRKERDERPVAIVRPKPDLPPVPKEITLSEAVTVKELAEKLNRKSKDVIAKLISRGVLANINQPLDPQVAVDVAREFGSEATIISYEEEVRRAAEPEAEPAVVPEDTGPVHLRPRPPVVTVMGHVDHGKTSLLDAIRTANVAAQEAGGITQHIGAYQVEARGRRITFLDTPGHEAFTLMRARGSRVTDIVVLVVAADDGVKPQTLEAIDHARAADVPTVVAINKIDKPNAAIERVKQQLADAGLLVEAYGGNTVCCEISAKRRTGIDELLDMILLVADLEEIQADPDKPGTGVVLETKLDRARGIVATVLVQNGTLRVGDAFIAGAAFGRVRALSDEHGRRLAEAGPATPVEVIGFAAEPTADDAFQSVADEARARQIAGYRQDKLRAESQARSARRTLESLSRQVAQGEVKELNIILKCDSQGSAEAIQKSLGELPSDKIRVRVLRSSIGAVTRADVLLASASNAIVVGFNVRPDRATADLAKHEEVEVRPYTVIYDLLSDIKQAMLGMLEPTVKESVLGQAEVRQLFRVPKVGTVAGCYVQDGKVSRGAEVRLLRDGVVTYSGRIGSLRRFKEDVSEVTQGFECGISIANYNDLKEGDVIEFFVTEKIAAESL